MTHSPFQKRLRTAARLALYGSLTLATATGAILVPFAQSRMDALLDQAWFDIDYESLEEVTLLQDFLRIDTTPTGSELEGARFLAAQLERFGFTPHIEEMANEKANLWAFLEGESKEALVLLNHIDVEEIKKPEEWEWEPFGAELDLPWIIGRGTFDMKTTTIAQLLAMKEIKEEYDRLGTKPPKSILFLATSSEETGSDIGTRWLLRHRPEILERSWAVLSEGGVLEASARGAIKYWGTSFAQKRFIEVEVCSDSQERIDYFVKDLREFNKELAPHPTPEPVREFLEAYGQSRDHPLYREILSRPDNLPFDRKAYETLPPYLQALFRNEAAVWDWEANPAGGFSARMIVHVLPGFTVEQALSEALPEWITHGLAMTFHELGPPESSSPIDHPIMTAIEATLTDRYGGDFLQGPYFLSFFTNDSRFFRQQGIPAYGFTPFQFMATDSLSMSGPNERVALPEYVEGVNLYRDLVRRLMALDPLPEDRETASGRAES